MTTEQKLVVVTGAASGIGKATTQLLASEGHKLVLVDKSASELKEIAEQTNAYPATLDVTDEQALRDLVLHVVAMFGVPDGLVTAAGITHDPLAAEDMPLQEWKRVITVDIQGTWLPAKILGEAMVREGRGSIVTLSSVAGMRSTPLHAYGPAKAAVIQMTQNLATQWGRQGVRVNGVAPGYTLTPLLESRIKSGARDVKLMEKNSALGRLVSAREVAETIEFLLTDRSSGITGATIPVDGGWLTTPSWGTYHELDSQK